MYEREELLEQLEERRTYQAEIVNRRPNDMIAFNHLSELRRHIKAMIDTHSLTNNKFLVFENIDYRSQSDDHSEVSKTPVFRCCQACCSALQFWMKDNTEKSSGTYYSMGNDNGEELGKKIIVYAGRTLAQYG